MSETKFTKGEWAVFETDGEYDGERFLEIGAGLECGEQRYICGSSFDMTSSTDDALPSVKEMECNFKLMASAPEMYKFLDDLVNGRGTDYPIESLLAKARGES